VFVNANSSLTRRVTVSDFTKKSGILGRGGVFQIQFLAGDMNTSTHDGTPLWTSPSPSHHSGGHGGPPLQL
jgi:hypothetical protein